MKGENSLLKQHNKQWMGYSQRYRWSYNNNKLIMMLAIKNRWIQCKYSLKIIFNDLSIAHSYTFKENWS